MDDNSAKKSLVEEKLKRLAKKVDWSLANVNKSSGNYLQQLSNIAILCLTFSPVVITVEYHGPESLKVFRSVLFLVGWTLLAVSLIFHLIDSKTSEKFWCTQLEDADRMYKIWDLSRENIIGVDAARKISEILGLGWRRSPSWPKILQTTTLLIGLLLVMVAVSITLF